MKGNKVPYVLVLANKESGEYIAAIPFLSSGGNNLSEIIPLMDEETQIRFVRHIFEKAGRELEIINKEDYNDYIVGISKINKLVGLTEKELEKNILKAPADKFIKENLPF